MEKHQRLAEAIGFAAKKHAGQVRKDGTPYIYHPLKVAELVKDSGYEIKYQIVAILHDVLEDTDATESEVKEFGEDVLVAVKLLTRPEGMLEGDYVNAILGNHMAAVVKNADKIHNMFDVAYNPDKLWGKRYVEKVQYYYNDKFSLALNKAIKFAEERLNLNEPKTGMPYYSPDEMELFAK